MAVDHIFIVIKIVQFFIGIIESSFYGNICNIACTDNAANVKVIRNLKAFVMLY